MFEVNRGRAIEVKEVRDSGAIAGYGSTFGNIDQGFDIVEKGAFAESLEERGLPKMLWGHDFFEPPIGKWQKASEDEHGLLLEGKLNLDTQRGQEVHSGLKMQTLDGLSIGYLEKESDVDKRGIRHLKEVELFEVSVVTFPMNEMARVDTVKNRIAQGIGKVELEKVLRDAGFSRTQAKRFIAEGYSGIAPRDAGDFDADGIDELKKLIQVFS
jgi:HK97 family phage prohead protease